MKVSPLYGRLELLSRASWEFLRIFALVAMAYRLVIIAMGVGLMGVGVVGVTLEFLLELDMGAVVLVRMLSMLLDDSMTIVCVVKLSFMIMDVTSVMMTVHLIFAVL